MWSELTKVWDQIDEMKEKTWLSIAPRKLRTQIDALLSQLRDMPARLRHYPSFDYVKRLLQSYAKVRHSLNQSNACYRAAPKSSRNFLLHRKVVHYTVTVHLLFRHVCYIL